MHIWKDELSVWRETYFFAECWEEIFPVNHRWMLGYPGQYEDSDVTSYN